MRIKQSEATPAKRRVYFTCVDTAALQTRLAASDMSAFVVFISKNAATPVSNASPVTEVGATNTRGLFYVELAVGDVDTIGRLEVIITNTGGTKTMEKREIDIEIYDPADGFYAADRTTVNAINTKTTNLPPDPASATNLATAQTSITAIKAKTDNLPPDPADASDIAAAFAVVSAAIAALPAAPSAATNASTLLATLLEGPETVGDAIRLLTSVLVGVASALEGSPPVFKSRDGTKTRVSGTYVGGVRTTTVRDGTP